MKGIQENVVEKIASLQWEIKYKEVDTDIRVNDVFLLEQKNGHISKIVLRRGNKNRILFSVKKDSKVVVTMYGSNERCAIKVTLNGQKFSGDLSMEFFFQSDVPCFNFTLNDNPKNGMVNDKDCSDPCGTPHLSYLAFIATDTNHDKGGGTFK